MGSVDATTSDGSLSKVRDHKKKRNQTKMTTMEENENGDRLSLYFHKNSRKWIFNDFSPNLYEHMKRP